MAATLQQQQTSAHSQNQQNGAQAVHVASPTQQPQQQILFTVEQIELVRRLRNSGITKEQIILAFDSLDRLDRELGPVYSIPISQAFTQQLFARQVLAAAAAVPIVQPPATPPQVIPPPPPPPPSTQKSPQLNGTSTPHRVPTPNKSNGGIGNDQNENIKMEVSIAEENRGSTISPPSGEFQNNPISIGDLILNPVEEIKDDNPEFMCFSAQGEPSCCDQIRAFVSKYNIRQQQIATLSRISQSYVSRFLKGDFFDMSERSRRAIKKWYIAYRSNPAAIGMAVNLVLLSHGAQNGGSPPSSTPTITSASSATIAKMTISDLSNAPPPPSQPNPEFLSQRRRERFVFRPNHLEILEKHFQEDSYPSFEKREEMARACNAATESLTGRPLGDKEVVTAQIVSNWFANKRKEMKKLAREEGLDLSQVPLRPRGRPCRFFGDLMAQIQEGQNSRDSSSTDVETVINGHLAEAQMLMNNESNAAVAAAAMAAATMKKKEEETRASASCRPAEEVVTVIPRAPEETAAEEEAAAAQQTPDERALSLSVELAAVNQAILSLTGQQPLGSPATSAVPSTTAATPATTTTTT